MDTGKKQDANDWDKKISEYITAGRFPSLANAMSCIVSAYAGALDKMDYGVLLRQQVGYIQQFLPEMNAALNTILQKNFKNFLVDTPETLGQCTAVLKSVAPYMPENLNGKIKEDIVSPIRKKEKISVDTALSIISLVLTILFFLYDQMTSQMLNQKEEKQTEALTQATQQLTDEVGYLEQAIRLLADEVGQLCDQLNSTAELGPDTQNVDNKAAEQEALR